MYSIVIADDEQTICNSILSVIQNAVPEIRDIKTFYSGNEVCEYIQENKVDIILLDIIMPGKSGLDIADIAAKTNPDSFVIIITAHHNFDFALRAANSKINAFLTKPFSSQQLIDVLRKAISHVRKQNTAKTNTRASRRCLIQTLCNKTMPKAYDNPYFCQDTIPYNDLICTEISLSSLGWSQLSANTQAMASQILADTIEHDTFNQTTVLFDCEEAIKILTFSSNEPDLSYLTDAKQIVSSFTNNEVSSVAVSFPSFAEYRLTQVFIQETDTYLECPSNQSGAYALKKMTNFLTGLSSIELEKYVAFLSSQLCISIQGPTVDSIVSQLEKYKNSINSTSANYLVNAACEYINKYYCSSSISLEATADHLNVSSAHLSRLFKKHLNQNFSSYLLRIRMEHAATLLTTTHLSTVEIAAATGYENPAYFRSAFKNFFAFTPKQYRQFALSNEEVNGLP